MSTEMVKLSQNFNIKQKCLIYWFLLDLTRLGVWVLDGDPGHSNLLKYALSETNFSNSLIILTVSMTTPWSWLDQLQHWMKLLADHVDRLKIDGGKYKRNNKRTP